MTTFGQIMDQITMLSLEKYKNTLRTIKSLPIILMILATLFRSADLKAQAKDPPFLKYINHPWVDSVLNTMTSDQKIAQCIWIAAYSNRDISHEVEVADLIRKYGIGGIIFFQGTAEKQAELTNYYQSIFFE